MTEVHAIILFDFFAERNCIIEILCENSHMSMVGNNDIHHYNNVFPSRTDENVLDVHIIVLIIPAKDGVFQSFHADMKGIKFASVSVRESPHCNPVESHLNC